MIDEFYFGPRGLTRSALKRQQTVLIVDSRDQETGLFRAGYFMVRRDFAFLDISLPFLTRTRILAFPESALRDGGRLEDYFSRFERGSLEVVQSSITMPYKYFDIRTSLFDRGLAFTVNLYDLYNYIASDQREEGTEFLLLNNLTFSEQATFVFQQWEKQQLEIASEIRRQNPERALRRKSDDDNRLRT